VLAGVLTVLVQELLVKIHTWQIQSGRSQIDQVVLFYNQFVAGFEALEGEQQ
jgi:hypothetical protein